MRTLVSLVGEEAAPNLFLALHFKPEALVWVYTKKTAEVAKNLRRAITLWAERNGLRLPVSIMVMVKADDDPWAVRDAVLGELNPGKWSELIFNITSGTKAMALGLIEAERHLRMKCATSVVYLGLGKKELLYLNKGRRERLKLPKIEAEVFLLAYGNKLVSKVSLSDRELRAVGELVYFLGDNLDYAEEVARNRANTPPPLPPRAVSARSLDILRRLGLLRGMKPADRKGDFWENFWGGDWLSVLIYQAILDEKLGEPLLGVKVEDTVTGAANEIDILVYRDMRIYAFECKFLTSKKRQKSSDPVYKIEQVAARLGGKGAVPVLCSNRTFGRAKKGRRIKFLEVQNLRGVKRGLRERIFGAP